MEAKTRHLVIPLQEAAVGMRLAVDICNAAGGVLVVSGTELSDSIIDGLRRRRIDVLAVLVPDPRSADEIVAEQLAARDRVFHLFHRHVNDPAARALMETVLDYRLKALS